MCFILLKVPFTLNLCGSLQGSIPSTKVTNYDKFGHSIHHSNHGNGPGGSAAAGAGKGSDIGI